VRQGYIVRSPRGRIATATAWEHLGLTAPAGEQVPLRLDDGPETGRLG
jgi:Holliday junction DNA helicase RuvB